MEDSSPAPAGIAVTRPPQGLLSALKEGPPRRFRGLLRQRQRLAKQDSMRADFDVSARLHFFHDATNHLARRPDHLRDLFLGKLPGHAFLPVGAFVHSTDPSRAAPPTSHQLPPP